LSGDINKIVFQINHSVTVKESLLFSFLLGVPAGGNALNDIVCLDDELEHVQFTLNQAQRFVIMVG
jgi:hypothetical protein